MEKEEQKKFKRVLDKDNRPKKKISVRKALFGKKEKEKKYLFKTKRTKQARRGVARRAENVRRLISGLSGKQVGRGRPKGSYKYNMPISEYQKLQSRKKILYSIYQQEQQSSLAGRGLTPEQINQIQEVRSREETIEKLPQNVADDELAFRKFVAQRTISPNTQRILVKLRRVQNKAKADDIEMQRRLRERKMVAAAGNLLETPYIFKDHQLDPTGINSDNILMAPNVFKEREDSMHILKPQRLNLLQTREAGNNLNFF